MVSWLPEKPVAFQIRKLRLSLCFPYSFLILSLFFPYGFLLVSSWFPCAFLMVSLWFPYGFLLVSFWFPLVPSFWFPWFSFGSLSPRKGVTLHEGWGRTNVWAKVELKSGLALEGHSQPGLPLASTCLCLNPCRFNSIILVFFGRKVWGGGMWLPITGHKHQILSQSCEYQTIRVYLPVCASQIVT